MCENFKIPKKNVFLKAGWKIMGSQNRTTGAIQNSCEVNMGLYEWRIHVSPLPFVPRS